MFHLVMKKLSQIIEKDKRWQYCNRLWSLVSLCGVDVWCVVWCVVSDRDGNITTIHNEQHLVITAHRMYLPVRRMGKILPRINHLLNCHTGLHWHQPQNCHCVGEGENVQTDRVLLSCSVTVVLLWCGQLGSNGTGLGVCVVSCLAKLPAA